MGERGAMAAAKSASFKVSLPPLSRSRPEEGMEMVLHVGECDIWCARLVGGSFDAVLWSGVRLCLEIRLRSQAPGRNQKIVV